MFSVIVLGMDSNDTGRKFLQNLELPFFSTDFAFAFFLLAGYVFDKKFVVHC